MLMLACYLLSLIHALTTWSLPFLSAHKQTLVSKMFPKVGNFKFSFSVRKVYIFI